MSDFTYDIRVENRELLDAWSELITRFPQMVPIAAQKIADKHAEPIESYLGQVPGEPVSPWPWVSERQRVAFFLTDGFGGGIPHQRGGVGSLEESWVVEVTYANADELAAIEVRNEAINTQGLPYVGFVEGWDQQPGFVETGWLQPVQIHDFMEGEQQDMFVDFTRFVDQAFALGGTE